MDILYWNIYECGLLKSLMSSDRFSEVLIRLAIMAMEKAQEISKGAIIRQFDRSEGTYMFTIYEDEFEKASNMLREIRELAVSYRRNKPFKVKLTEGGALSIENGFASHTLEDVNSITYRFHPVKIIKKETPK